MNSGQVQRGGVTVILMAGSRPGHDPIASAAGVPTKALVPVAGLPMIERPLRALLSCNAIGRVHVIAQDPALFATHPATAWMAEEPRISLETGQAGIAQSLLALMDGGRVKLPCLVTTADHVLLSPAMIDDFLGGAAGSDLAVGLVERRILLACYPQSRRTWLKLRDGWWSGANLFWIGSMKARPIVALWQDVEKDRKKGWKVLGAFGPLLLTGALLRLLTLRQGIARVGRRFGMEARLVAMDQAEACIDADKPDDIVLIEAILAAR